MSDALETVLRINDIDVYYGEIPAVLDASMEVRRSEIVCVLGPNGAGKTTLLKAVIGSVKNPQGFNRVSRRRRLERAPLDGGHTSAPNSAFIRSPPSKT